MSGKRKFGRFAGKSEKNSKRSGTGVDSLTAEVDQRIKKRTVQRAAKQAARDRKFEAERLRNTRIDQAVAVLCEAAELFGRAALVLSGDRRSRQRKR